MKNAFARIRHPESAKSSSGAIIRNVATQMFILLVNFGTGLIIARSFGRIGRGEVTAMILWPTLLSSLFSLGVPNGVVFYMRRHAEREGSYLAAAFALSTIASIAMVVTGYFVIPHALHKYDAATVRAAQLIVFLSPFNLFSASMSGFFQARYEFGYFNLLRYLTVVPTLFFLLLLLAFGKLTPVTAALCYQLPPIPIFFVSLRRLFGMTKFTTAKIGVSMKALIGYGVRGSGLDLISGISSQVDQVLVVGLLSVADMGVYAVSLSVSRTLGVFFAATSNVVMPKSVSLTPDATTAYVGRALRLASTAGIAAAIILSIIVPFLLPLVYGHQFSRSAPIAIALFAEFIFTGSTGVLSATFMARGRPGTVTILEGASLTFNVALMLLLIPRMGLWGAVDSLIVTGFVRFLAFYLIYERVVAAKAPPLLLQSGDIRYVRALAFDRFRPSQNDTSDATV